MTFSGWFAITCWGIVVAAVLFGVVVLVRDELRKPQEPERLDFRDWLDDWDEWS